MEQIQNRLTHIGCWGWRRNELLAGKIKGENPVQRSQMVLKDHLDERGNVPQNLHNTESRASCWVQYQWRPGRQC